MERVIQIVDYYQRKNNNQTLFDKQVQSDVPLCRRPWNEIVINEHGLTYNCASPAWLPKSIGSIMDYDDIFELLNSHEAQSIRSEIDLHRYTYCNHNICGYFASSNLKDKYSTEYKETTLLTANEFTAMSTVSVLPSLITFDFDYTCNFKCPSCRSDIINYNSGSVYAEHQLLANQIKKVVLDRYATATRPVTIRWAGGEPLISKVYLDLWEYIIKLDNKNIRNVIQTNGSYLIKKTQLLTKMVPYIDTLRISFDAGTAETYEKVRVNGRWQDLIKNCQHVKKLIAASNIELHSDFVVQLANFREIPLYIAQAKELGFTQINLSKMWNWDTWSAEEFMQLNVTDKNHPLHNELVSILAPYKTDKSIVHSVC